MLKIACVDYHNTIPFQIGFSRLRSTLDFELHNVIPSECARLFAHEEVDMALVPVATLPQLKDAHLLSDYCIGGIGKVNTVAILSQVPLNQISSLHLDPHSKTSNALVQILLNHHWKKDVVITNGPTKYDNISQLAIGDKVFSLEAKYPYKYDLCEAWYEMTDLPFCFAIWVVRSTVSTDDIARITKGFDSVFPYSDDWLAQNVNVDQEVLKTYLKRDIKFIFDAEMKAGLLRFFSLLNPNYTPKWILTQK